DTGQGGAICNAGTSSATITGSTFKSCHAPSDGSAIYNAGYLLLGSSTITENTCGSEDGGAVTHRGDSMSLTEGASYILGNKGNTGKARDICLDNTGSASHIFIAGALTGSQIGVYMPFTEAIKPTAGTPIAFTGDWSKFNSVKPGVVFKSNTSYGIAESGTSSVKEAAFAVSGGSMYNAFDYEFTFTKAASAPQKIYPGMAVSYEIDLSILRKEQSGPDTPLFLNPADRKLYTNHTGSNYSGLAEDSPVSIKAELWNGGTLANDNLSWTVGDGKITVTISGAASPGPYTIKLNLTFLGQPRPASFSMTCDKSAEAAACGIKALTASPAAALVVEGVDNTSAATYFDDLNQALRAAAVNVGIDLRNCSDLTKIKAAAFIGCAKLNAICLSDAIVEIEGDAFTGCAGGFTITYQGTKEQWGHVKRPAQNSAATNWHDGAKDKSASAGSVTCSDGSKCGFDYKVVPKPADFVAVAGATVSGQVTKSNVFKEGRTVTIGNLWVCDHEVTQGEYGIYCKYGASTPSANHGLGDKYPAYYVSWYDAIVYCNLRSMAEGLDPVYALSGETDPTKWSDIGGDGSGKYCGPSGNRWNDIAFDTAADGYRLPTEEEWEYIARNKNQDAYEYAGSDTIGDVAWYYDTSEVGGKHTTHEVKTTPQANGLGIYDMSGKVQEWCWNLFGAGNPRIQRGGDSGAQDYWCTVYCRSGASPWNRQDNYGFRVVRNAP
ncbi:MAG: formylglycine-generating enzyme family protein, partial [Treponema sp.]|nr:formylglycine-generating enzyme family protein [Treponema sp.]